MRFPPIEPSDEGADYHPTVNSLGWCGEFKPHPEMEKGAQKPSQKSAARRHQVG